MNNPIPDPLGRHRALVEHAGTTHPYGSAGASASGK